MPNLVGTYDLGPDGKTILVSLMNAVEGSDFQVSDFVFLDPVAIDRTDPQTGEVTNSMVKLNYIAGTGNYGVKTIYYNRIRATDFGSLTIPRGTAISLVDLLPFINSKFGIDIKPTEVVSVLIPDGALVTVPFQFQTSSIIYTGSSTITVGEPVLDTFQFNEAYGGGVYKAAERFDPLYFFVNVKNLPVYDNYFVRFSFEYSTDYGPATITQAIDDVDATLEEQVAGSDLNCGGIYPSRPSNMQFNTLGLIKAQVFANVLPNPILLRTLEPITVEHLEGVS